MCQPQHWWDSSALSSVCSGITIRSSCPCRMLRPSQPL